MNPANLEIEGVLLAVEALQRLLVEKGLIGAGELDEVLHNAEASFTGDARLSQLPPPSRDAVVLPIRFLREALASAEPQSFATLVRRLGEKKSRYNDQM